MNEMKVPPLSWWDTGRCLVHGKFDATLLGGEMTRGFGFGIGFKIHSGPPLFKGGDFVSVWVEISHRQRRRQQVAFQIS